MKFGSIKSFIHIHLDGLKLLANIFLLVVWVLVQVHLGNKFYALFSVLFFFVLLISRKRLFVLIAVSILAISLFNLPTLGTLSDIKKVDLDVIQHPSTALTDIFTANSGQDVLQGVVPDMLSLLRSNHIDRYQLSNQFLENEYTNERIFEAAWPIKMDRTSPYYLVSHNDIKDYSTCTIIDQRKYVILAQCH